MTDLSAEELQRMADRYQALALDNWSRVTDILSSGQLFPLWIDAGHLPALASEETVCLPYAAISNRCGCPMGQQVVLIQQYEQLRKERDDLRKELEAMKKEGTTDG